MPGSDTGRPPERYTPDAGGETLVIVRDSFRSRWLRFRRPRSAVCTDDPAEVMPLLRDLEALVARGASAAGFVAYEAAPGFDAALPSRPADGFPLLWFGLFDEPEVISLPGTSEAADLLWTPSVTSGAYREAVRRIREEIREGNTYQVNYTFRLRARAPDDPWGLFLRMIRAQGPGFGAFLDTGRWVICSSSPELFFRLEGSELVSTPMKGTAPRGLSARDDRDRAAWLRNSEKNRAENVMIVDMVRNDMGRIAASGTVRAGPLFATERYPTLWQMTSTVSCRTEAGIPEIFRALFPGASITGAPKVRTMQIIQGLETTPRRIYTGAIGFFGPDRRAQFSIAIRTALVDRREGMIEYGIGSGIVWDSEEGSEYEECLLKAAVLLRPPPDVSLLETFRWTPEEGYFLADEHLERMRESAEYFGIPFDGELVRRALSDAAGRFPGRPQRVRLVLAPGGRIDVEAGELAEPPAYRIRTADRPITRTSPLLYHKTTDRRIYEEALASASGFQDVLLWNEEGELTESCIANVAVELDGRLVTPPVGSGLLPGVFRSRLLADGMIRERVVRLEDLARATRVVLFNSVRGMWQVRVEEAGR